MLHFDVECSKSKVYTSNMVIFLGTDGEANLHLRNACKSLSEALYRDLS